jgi:hypothetical protein
MAGTWQDDAQIPSAGELIIIVDSLTHLQPIPSGESDDVTQHCRLVVSVSYVEGFSVKSVNSLLLSLARPDKKPDGTMQDATTDQMTYDGNRNLLVWSMDEQEKLKVTYRGANTEVKDALGDTNTYSFVAIITVKKLSAP